jgi:hypothetical protein
MAHCDATEIARTNCDLKIVRFFLGQEIALQPEVAAWRHLLAAHPSPYSHCAFIPTTYQKSCTPGGSPSEAPKKWGFQGKGNSESLYEIEC